MDIEELTGKIADAWERYRRADADRTQAALDTGAALIELREGLPHGDFLPAVERLGIGKTTAQNWMRLSRAGLKSATVADLGGIRAALEHLRQRATTADDVRRRELESENVELKRQVGDMLATATPEQLEMLAPLVRLQVEIQETRQKLNLGITKRNARQRENTRLKKEITSLEQRERESLEQKERESLEQDRESLRDSIAIQSP